MFHYETINQVCVRGGRSWFEVLKRGVVDSLGNSYSETINNMMVYQMDSPLGSRKNNETKYSTNLVTKTIRM